MVAQVKAWGNGQGIRLSKELLNSLNIHKDDLLDIKVEDGKIILSKTFKHKTLEERVKEFGGEMPKFEEYNWGQPEGREVW